MAKTNPAEDEALRQRVLAELGKVKEDEASIEKIDEAEWMKLLLIERFSLKMRIDEHNSMVQQFNFTLELGRQVEKVSGLRPRYFVHREEGYPVIEIDSKRYGFIRPDSEADQPDESVMEDEIDEEGLEELDADEWFLVSFQIIANLNRISERLSVEIMENIAKQEEIESIKEKSGLRVTFLYNPDTGELGYGIEKKEPMGFSVPVAVEEPETKSVIH